MKKETKDSGCNTYPFFEVSLISFSYIPRNPKKPSSSYTQNSFHLVGFQAHLMTHITMASACAPLSHYGTETMIYIYKEAYWFISKWIKSWCPLMPPDAHYFSIFPIWSTPFGKFYPTFMNPHEWKKILIWNLSLERKWWFFTIQKNSSVCREWQSISGGEVPLAQYCTETGFRTDVSEY